MVIKIIWSAVNIGLLVLFLASLMSDVWEFYLTIFLVSTLGQLYFLRKNRR